MRIHHALLITAVFVAASTITEAQRPGNAGDAGNPLASALSNKSTLVVIRSAKSDAYVFTPIGAWGPGENGFLALHSKQTGETLGAAAPAGGSYWAFQAVSVGSVVGKRITFADGARVVVGFITDKAPVGEVTSRLLRLPDVGDGAIKTDCFQGGCMNGVVGTIGTSLKWVDSASGAPGNPVLNIEMDELVLTTPCAAAARVPPSVGHWKCAK